MSDWLGVEDDYDAKKSGRGIGSWDNFEDDNDGWKGGATSSDGASSEDMLSAVASMGDDELLGHDIWFVATGASDCDGAGMKAFLASHRDKLRGVFFINLESVGAGRLSVVTVEGVPAKPVFLGLEAEPYINPGDVIRNFQQYREYQIRHAAEIEAREAAERAAAAALVPSASDAAGSDMLQAFMAFLANQRK